MAINHKLLYHQLTIFLGDDNPWGPMDQGLFLLTHGWRAMGPNHGYQCYCNSEKNQTAIICSNEIATATKWCASIQFIMYYMI